MNHQVNLTKHGSSFAFGHAGDDAHPVEIAAQVGHDWISAKESLLVRKECVDDGREYFRRVQILSFQMKTIKIFENY